MIDATFNPSTKGRLLVLMDYCQTPTNAELLKESFENLRSKKGWHIQRGVFTGDSGTQWNTHNNGVELQRNIVSTSSDGEVHIELDGHGKNSNVKLSTDVTLNGSSTYTLSFDIKPRSGGKKRGYKDTSDMRISFADIVINIDANSKGKLTTSTKSNITIKTVEDGWSRVTIEYSLSDMDETTLLFEGYGSDDTYGMLVDNILLVSGTTTKVSKYRCKPKPPQCDSTQKEYLETLLIELCYSATFVNSAKAFESEYATHLYSGYILNHSKAKLSKTLQKRVRESIYSGDDLLLLGYTHASHKVIESILGIKALGNNSKSVEAIEVIHDEYSYLHEPLSTKSKNRRIKPTQEVDIIANYITSKKTKYMHASTTHQYGEGRATFIAFDIIAEAMVESHYEALLQEVLRSLKASSENYSVGDIVPLLLNIENLGMTTPVEITLHSNGATFVDALYAQELNSTHILFVDDNLSEQATRSYSIWLKPLSLTSQIDAQIVATLDGDRLLAKELNYTLNVLEAKTLQTIESDLNSITLSNKKDQQRLKKSIKRMKLAIKELNRGKETKVINHLLYISTQLSVVSQTATIHQLRIDIANYLKQLDIKKGAN